MPKFIACLWAGLLAGLLATSPARAEPASTSSVETLLALTKAERLLDAVYASMESSIGQGMRAATAGRSVTPEQQRVLDAAPARMAAVMRSELRWEVLKPLIVKVYVDTFDQDEVDGLNAFFRTPVGQRFADKQPLVAQRSAVAMQSVMAALIPRMQAAMQSLLQEAGVQ